MTLEPSFGACILKCEERLTKMLLKWSISFGVTILIFALLGGLAYLIALYPIHALYFLGGGLFMVLTIYMTSIVYVILFE